MELKKEFRRQNSARVHADFGLFQTNDTQTLPHPIRNGPIFMEYAQCAEMYEKSNSRFLRFLLYELWWILYSKFLEN